MHMCVHSFPVDPSASTVWRTTNVFFCFYNYNNGSLAESYLMHSPRARETCAGLGFLCGRPSRLAL